MLKQTPVVFINGLIGCLDHSTLHKRLCPLPVIVPDLLGYGRLSGVTPCNVNIPSQIEHLHREIGKHASGGRVHLVGHSVGGVVAMLYARRYRDQVASITSVEGNFSLKDAFWSSSVAKMSAQETEALLAGYRANPKAWMERAGVASSQQRLEVAMAWLAHQPSSTVQAMARSVLVGTGGDDYHDALKAIFSSIPVHLLAGERSRAEWDVPDWAIAQSASITIMREVGHLMMLEQPQAFAQEIAQILDQV
ncbi:alpha/beta hydrolase [Pseudomonas sp. NEEL19]|uniref:alpha/beta fold hydrolase n=1 Tax=Pseudomonas sp. NEEL19 TaxID=2867409 RepID=UPI0023675473|nr:alpha/beta hydrolase [Pseudomonas sp. NEEL19]WDM61363.1 alpha/beta hydrolase [Pseudomonas sp. NEEL19]